MLSTMDEQDAPQYDVLIDERVTKRAHKLPRKHFEQIMRRIKELETEPRPNDSIHLKGKLEGYRIDVGEYRILYTVDFHYKTVVVYRLLNRKEGYPSSM